MSRRFLRLQLWLTAPWRCKLGRHVTREGYVSYGSGVMTYHCTRCERGFLRFALDDTSADEQAQVQEIKRLVEQKLGYRLDEGR